MRTPWILEREGYYSIVNGYKDPFLDKEAGKRTHEDRYLTGTSFNDLYALFVFDRNLRFLLFRMTTGSVVRGNIARSFTALYKDSHRHGEEITSIQLDKIYRRIKDFRNICAHDERLYCAHPHDRNITVFQLVKDLRLVTDKKRYLEFLQQLESLLVNLEKDIPDYIGYVCCEMGLQNVDVLQTWIQTSRKL